VIVIVVTRARSCLCDDRAFKGFAREIRLVMCVSLLVALAESYSSQGVSLLHY
jgi:hypothetical protein